MGTPKKLPSWTKIESIRYELEGSLNDAISFLQKARTKYTKEGWTDLNIEIDTEQEAYGDSVYATVDLRGSRMETQDEANKRETAEYNAKEVARQRDLRTFEELKKRLGVD